VSLSDDDGAFGNSGRLRARAVSFRASSRALVGLVFLLLFADEGGVASGEVLNVDGRILPINVQRFLLGVVGVSLVSFGVFSVVSSLVRPAKDCRLEAVGLAGGEIEDALDEDDITPSNPRKRLEAGDWLSLRIMRRRRPGAG